MKSLITSLLVVVVVSVNFHDCTKQLCDSQRNQCDSDMQCTKILNFCQKKCEILRNINCLETCLISSQSQLIQELNQCSVSNQCFLRIPNGCPTTCLESIKQGESVCKVEHDGIADWQCIVKYQIAQDRPECASKQCVCDSTLTLDIYVAGCFC